MLILDLVILIVDLLLAGNYLGRAFRKEGDKWTIVSGIFFLALGIYFALILIGESASIAQSLTVQV